ncbi:unnamed protein product [Litomosoides sigmodontis]|uniref:GPI ethanolamine phosphate transferase 2 C-terminal domain-containing protein n=1 Tax=Litomosoides sigmodontis TaxID=42156 RepID=A0A3P6VA51_LITSI|nr:unnamed protein product [Litomosoides sigmodontis]
MLVLCLLQIGAVFLFTSGFFFKQIHPYTNSEKKEEDVNNFLNGCSHDSILKETLTKQTVAKLVIILIDAWQEQFFYGRKTMQFLRQLTSDGQAVAFIAHVQTPTVTMPRIKAVTTGMVPSFVDIVMNFASTFISNDNIIDRFNGEGYRCTFCGDETWLRLFPNRFDNHSVGVTSFYVNDFKEVDDIVTHCMRSRLENSVFETWDVMILHYLGLDHIGHSLGGTHSELDNKLIEMDSIIKEIYERLHTVHGTNFSIVVFGDHGMTRSGSHGGSSELETHTPIVYVDGKKRRSSNETLYVASVEQVDIVPTLAGLLNVPIPKASLGVTLLPYIGIDWPKISILLLILRNAEQFRKLGRTSDKLNHCISLSYDSLQKHCTMNVALSIDGLVRECLEELHKVQMQLIHMETDVDTMKIVIAIGLSFTISYICGRLAYFAHSRDTCVFENGSIISIHLAVFAQLIHSCAFFASSLVEEEHDLHYFFFSSCLFAMLMEEFHAWLRNRNGSVHHSNTVKFRKMILLFFLIVIHRLCRGYTESNRRRWILENRSSSSNSTNVMNFYEILTSIGDSKDIPDFSSLLKQFSILRFIFCSFSLLLIGIGFISCYDKKTDHMWLMRLLILVILLGTFLAQYYKSEAIFLVVFLLNIFLLLLLRDLFLSLTVWTILIMRTYNLPLCILQLILGYCLAWTDATPFVVILAIFSSFFYLGNSNNLSTIDIATGFAGVETYQPIRIAVQIVLNTYSGPLLTIFGWRQYLVGKSVTSNSLPQKRNSLLCWMCSVLHLNMSLCLLSLYIQRYHLFVCISFSNIPDPDPNMCNSSVYVGSEFASKAQSDVCDI